MTILMPHELSGGRTLPRPRAIYRNPIVCSDLEDAHVCRAGEDYYMTCSSRGSLPGLPLFHSRNLLHWAPIGHALARFPADLEGRWSAPGARRGVIDPCFRYHRGMFYIFFCDPEAGLFMTSARDPRGPWRPLHCVEPVKGWARCCPFWDQDGQAYLLHGYADDAAGSGLDLCRMSSDGTMLLEGQTSLCDADGVRVEDFSTKFTLRGARLLRREDWYYLLAVGESRGDYAHLALRSAQLQGPYEARMMLHRGAEASADVGECVDTPDGRETWLLHARPHGAMGPALHLQPVRWVRGWPVAGRRQEGLPTPVDAFRRPAAGPGSPRTPARSTSIAPALDPRWHWRGGFREDWRSADEASGRLRLFAVPMAAESRLFDAPHVLVQRFPAAAFQATAVLDLGHLGPQATAGLVLVGAQTAAIHCRRDGAGLRLTRTEASADTAGGDLSAAFAFLPRSPMPLYLRLEVQSTGRCMLSYSADGISFSDLGAPLTLRGTGDPGPRIGLFAVGGAAQPSGGWVELTAFQCTSL